ncbi:Zinc finger and SCAN domain-containing protein 10 [Orchesella cincta]|uniref:Zinc finger and SCAN domain-containing protein 10 n=1 Tax=Orchesella cincta TaxID=48709 RepID=A0A1D2MFT2_ORCCI|nr:Zinc finger and SCAN domain-containing protein 10 [Orchesella cincta]
MSSEAETPPPGSVDLETVSVWYSCREYGGNCSTWFYSIPLLQKHFAEKHPSLECKLPDDLSPEILQGKITFYEGDELREGFPHRFAQPGSSTAATVGQEIKCILCSDNFESWDALGSHLKRDHSNRKIGDATSKKRKNSGRATNKKARRVVATCPTRRQALQKSSNSRKIIKTKQSHVSSSITPKLHCPHCSKSFERNYNFRRHLVTHSGVRPYSCEICGASKSLRESLINHLHVVHNLQYKNAKKVASEAGLKFLKTKKNVNLEEVHPTKIISAVIASIIGKSDNAQASTSASVTKKGTNKVNQLNDNTKQGKIRCPHCPYETDIKLRFKKHRNLHKEGANAAVCAVCGWFMSPGTAMNNHHRARHQPKAGGSINN